MAQGKSVAEGRAATGWRRLVYRVGPILISTLVSLFFAELALRVVEKQKARHDDSLMAGKLISDPELGNSLPPYTLNHDANGFRNDSVPAQVSIVTVGDSQTWGVNVDRVNGWPQQLGRISGRSVYDMSLPSYGPVQYCTLAQRSFRLSPKVVVVGLYLGNDIYDSYRAAYESESHSAIRDSERASALMQDTVRPKATSFRNEHLEFQRRYGILTGFGLSYWSRAHLALGRALNNLLLALGSDVDFKADEEWAAAFPEQGTVYTTAGTETVFLTSYRLMALDLDEPRIAEGLRITKALLPRMRTAADANGAKLLVLLIPTKESVYAEALSEKVQLSTKYAKIVEMEGKIRSELISTCHQQAIESVDALPFLSDAIRRGEPIYPSTADEHFKAGGYQILAARVNDALAKLHW
jgi:lysophospholipase L1-like esterase